MLRERKNGGENQYKRKRENSTGSFVSSTYLLNVHPEYLSESYVREKNSRRKDKGKVGRKEDLR